MKKMKRTSRNLADDTKGDISSTDMNIHNHTRCETFCSLSKSDNNIKTKIETVL
jgi:hypothetical protein